MQIHANLDEAINFFNHQKLVYLLEKEEVDT